MGTNYYLYRDVCEHCGRPADVLHIGKSSAGWAFALHVYRETWDEGPETLEQWKREWSAPGTEIRNEYGDVVTPEEMLSHITERSHPRGLKRVSPDGRHCLENGDGTWDYIGGDFS